VRTLVVGVGNDGRGDDAVGPLVARLLADALAADPPAGVEVVAWTGDPMGLLDLWAGVDRLVLVDAIASGAAPGTCRRLGPDARFRTDAGGSTHGLGLSTALALARAMERAPACVEVWGIEGTAFESGAPLTPAVALAALALAARLSGELGETVSARPAGRPA
jgi:hydrogenase maturation protease